jgi:hypothetical protein
MTRTLLLVMVMLVIAAPLGWGQVAVSLSAGPSVYTATTPHGAINLSIGLCSNNEATCSMTTFEARGSANDLPDVIYSTQTGVQQTVVSAQTGAVKIDVFALGQGGAVTTSSSTGMGATAGGGLKIHPATAPNWTLTLSAKEMYSVAGNGWSPWFNAQVGYTFHGAATSLSQTFKRARAVHHLGSAVVRWWE